MGPWFQGPFSFVETECIDCSSSLIFAWIAASSISSKAMGASAFTINDSSSSSFSITGPVSSSESLSPASSIIFRVW